MFDDTPSDDTRFAEVRTFLAPTMSDALAQVRLAYGDRAVILRSRERERTGIGRWLTGPEIELTAGLERPRPLPTEHTEPPAADATSSPQRMSEHPQAEESTAPPVKRVRKTAAVGPAADCPVGDGSPAAVTNAAKPTEQPNSDADAREAVPIDAVPLDTVTLGGGASIRDQIEQIVAALDRIEAQRTADSTFIQELAAVGIGGPSATRIARDADRVVGEGVRPDAALRAAIAARIDVDAERPLTAGEQRRIAVVGPAGVGKTTTVAKLAAASILNDGRSVGLISLDTQRVAAADQMKAYAELLSVPLRIASTNEQARRAVGEMAECDILMVDTPGCGPRDAERVAELKARLRAIAPDEVVVCLSAVTGPSHNARAAAVFETLRPTAFIATKVDEADQLGPLICLCDSLSLPLQVITTGQTVPTDFEWADADRIAQLTLGAASLFPDEVRRAA